MKDIANFHKLKKVFNSSLEKLEPIAILQSENATDISNLIKKTVNTKTPILIRSGGHSYAGFSTGKGVLLMLENSKPFSRTFPSGEYSSVGLAGYFLGGGHSKRSLQFWKTVSKQTSQFKTKLTSASTK